MAISDNLHLLDHETLSLNEASLEWITYCGDYFEIGDYFVRLSQGNSRIEVLYLYPYLFNDGQEERVWERIGKGIGNLEALRVICICGDAPHDDEVIPDWGRLACILRHVRQSVTINIDEFYPYQWGPEEMLPFVQAIHGHPTITDFEGGDGRFPYESMSMLYSALATLPALESVQLYAQAPDDGYTLANPETLTELLRVPTLCSVQFSGFYFTRALSQATANALTEGTEIFNLMFKDCSFSDEECAVMMANGLSKNTSVTSLQILTRFDEALNCALAADVASNSTLRHISYRGFGDALLPNLSPLFLALGKNTALSTIGIRDCAECMDESLCTAMEYGLGMNESLRELELVNIVLDADNFALWCRALSFLRINKALRVLKIHMEQSSCASAFRMRIAAMLQENASLVDVTILTRSAIKAEEYVALLPTLKNNTTLETLCLQMFKDESLRLTDSEDKQIGSLLKKNYGLKRLPGIHRAGDVDAILQLNESGRRYLIQDGSSISKGVDVLSNVSMDINCVFFHLLENPRLCDRSAV
jgi:hypothetical protein